MQRYENQQFFSDQHLFKWFIFWLFFTINGMLPQFGTLKEKLESLDSTIVLLLKVVMVSFILQQFEIKTCLRGFGLQSKPPKIKRHQRDWAIQKWKIVKNYVHSMKPLKNLLRCVYFRWIMLIFLECTTILNSKFWAEKLEKKLTFGKIEKKQMKKIRLNGTETVRSFSAYEKNELSDALLLLQHTNKHTTGTSSRSCERRIF